jgi:hypothetical protein
MKMKLLQPPEFVAKEHGDARYSNDTSARYGQKARHRRQHGTPRNLAQTYRRMNRHTITAERRFSFPPLFPLGRAKHRRKLWVSVDTPSDCDVFTANFSTVALGQLMAWADIQSARSGKRPRVGLLFSGPERIRGDGPRGGDMPPEAMTVPWGRDGFALVTLGAPLVFIPRGGAVAIGGMIMAHRDGDLYYMMVTLVENGEQTSRRMHRVEWQGKDGKWHFLEGKHLPPDLTMTTGQGFKDKHFMTFLGVDTQPVKSAQPKLPTKSDLMYVVIGAALVLLLKGAITLAIIVF